ncbi:MAG: hypothetical protein J2P13_02155 [Acidobacteria bacterium]|nr:hypothetical protein [Acidobacteriota bacterium]
MLRNIDRWRGWGVVGPLVGVVLGSLLTRSWQRNQWIRDNKRAEYRELITVLSESDDCIANNPHRYDRIGTQSPGTAERDRLSDKAEERASAIINDRIVISETVLQKVREHWSAFLRERNIAKVWGAEGTVHQFLLKLAREDLKLKD